MAYETPVERATLELLGRIADALEGIRYAISTSQAFLAQENLSLRSSNSALSDTLRRVQGPTQPVIPPASIFDVEAASGKNESLVPNPTPRQVLNETENAVEEPKDYRFTMPTVSDPSGKGE